jgi:hypothetical protein
VARKTASEEKQAKRFALILALLLSAFASYSLWRHHPSRAPFLFGAAVAVVGCAFLAYPLWRRAFRGWMKFAGPPFVMTQVV